jgi:hypothetical protein
MELDELKATWAQYDKKLSQNLKFNEELLKKMNLEKSRKELQKPLMYEIAGVLIGFVFFVYTTAVSIRFVDEPKYAVPGFVAAVVCLAYTVFSVIKANKFLSIDYYNSSVLKLQKDIARLNKLVLRLRKYELLMFPLFVLPLLPVLIKAINNVDIYANTTLLIFEIVFTMGIGYPLCFWINKQLYDKKFRNTVQFLKEIEAFEAEG